MAKVIYVKNREPKKLRIVRQNPYTGSSESALKDHLLNRYDIDLGEELGRGGIGIVYRARERTCGQDLVVKTIIPGSSVDKENLVALLRKEIKDTPQDSQFIPTWQKIGKTPEGVIFAYRPYIEGRALGDLNAEHIEKGQILPIDFSVFLIHLAAKVLKDSHEKGVSHRDFCPMNLLVNTTTGYPSLLDWGWPGVTDGVLFGGKQAYIAPELISAPQTLRPEGFCRADMFSLGTVLYEMISGFNPFTLPENSKDESFDYRLTDAFNPEKIPALNSVCADATREISEITSACLKENPKERISAGGLYDCLCRYLYDRVGGLGVTAPAISSYVRLFSGKEPAFKLDSITFGHLRRGAEDQKFEDPTGADKKLKDIAREHNVNLSDPHNASRTFIDAFGKERIKSTILSLYTNLSEEERAEISAYSSEEINSFLEKQDPATNKEIHLDVAKQALGREV
jgi:serine/threonine protein kinase